MRSSEKSKNVSGYLAHIDANLGTLIVAVLVSMFAFGQLTDPFVAHDDFDWLLGGKFDQGFETPWSKAFSEGRWINYPWSLVTDGLNSYSAFAIYLVAYSCFAVLAGRLISGKFGAVSGLLVFFAPMGANTMLWPVTQIPGTLIFCVAFALMAAAERDRAKLTIMPFAVIAGFLCYPAYGPLLLILYGASFSASWRGTFAGAMVYVASFIGAVLVAFSLNYVFQGHFTIQPAPWREATPIFETGTLRSNFEKYASYYTQAQILLPAVLISALGYGVCFAWKVRVRQCVAILLFSLMILSMEATLSIIAGIALPLRSSIWLWATLCAPALFLFYSERQRTLGAMLAFGLLIVGGMTWERQFRNIRAVFPAMRHLGHEVSAAMAINAGRFDSVVIYGDAKANPQMAGLHSNRALRNFLFKDFGIYSTSCSPELCKAIQNELSALENLPSVLILDRRLAVILSANSGDPY